MGLLRPRPAPRPWRRPGPQFEGELRGLRATGGVRPDAVDSRTPWRPSAYLVRGPAPLPLWRPVRTPGDLDRARADRGGGRRHLRIPIDGACSPPAGGKD